MKGVFIMSAQKKLLYRTAESVSPGHPDKICDQISDAILDAYLAVDQNARVAVEVCGGHGTVFVTGEVTARDTIDISPIVKRLAGNVEIIEHIATQSTEIARGVDIGGAGDQGIMVGYACDETPELLPLEVVLARRLNQHLYGETGNPPGAAWATDGKTQVTLRNGTLISVVASFQSAPTERLAAQVSTWLRKEPLLKGRVDEAIELFINPAGEWSVGGFDADAGLTGRKLIVDAYGPHVPIGGGAYSGKDATKVDRSAAYMARRVAVDYLRARDAHEVYCTLAYAIGRDQPLEATVIIDGVEEVVAGYDLSPRGIITALDLQTPQFEQTARYGHFGHGFTWDK